MTEQNKQIREAFAELEKSKFCNSFILSLRRQYKSTKTLSDKQCKALFEIRGDLVKQKKQECVKLIDQFETILE